MWSHHERGRFIPLSLLFLLLSVLPTAAVEAQAQELNREIFIPAQGKGSIVVVVSGASGTKPYRDFGSKLAERGYYTVLMEGNDVFDAFKPKSNQGESNLKKIIVESQSALQALPGKVALMGFSAGGTGVLIHGAPLREEVSVVVAFYPTINRLGIEMSELAAKLRSPVLVLAAEKDEQLGCCKIESMRELAAAPKAAPFELVVYPDAGHAFNLHLAPFIYRADDAADAWERTIALLTRMHPPGGQQNALSR